MLLQIIRTENDVLLHQKLSDIAASNSHHLTKILGSDSLGNTNWERATNVWKLFEVQYIPDECEIVVADTHIVGATPLVDSGPSNLLIR